MNLATAASVFAGDTPATSVYYGQKKIWPFSGWRQIGDTLLPPRSTDTWRNEFFGQSVSINSTGDILAIGHPGFYRLDAQTGNFSQFGRAFIFIKQGKNWVKQAEIIYPEPWNDFTLDHQPNSFGRTVHLNAAGNILAVGAPLNKLSGEIFNASGVTCVFAFDGLATWNLAQKIPGQNYDEYSGTSIYLNSPGTIIAIGAPGVARIFSLSVGTYTQIGPTLYGGSGDLFGQAVALSSASAAELGTRVIVGAPHSSTSFPGTVKIFEYNGADWEQVGQTLTGLANGHKFGSSVALSSAGDICAVGAPNNGTGASNRGSVTIYKYEGGLWTQRGSTILGEAAGDNSGAAISMSPDGLSIAVGARNNDGNGSNSGHVRVYVWDGSEWQKRGGDIDGIAVSDAWGTSVALDDSGNNIVAGAPLNDTEAINSGHVRVFEYIT